MKKILILLTGLILTSSCSNEPKTSNKLIDIVVDVENLKVEELDILDAEPLVFEEVDSALLYNIYDLIFIDKYICIRATNGVYLYQNDGTYIGEVGKKGRGPGEYLGVSSIFSDGQSIFITDWTGKAFYEYDLERNFIEKTPWPEGVIFSNIKMLGNSGNYVGLRSWHGIPFKTPKIVTYNKNLELIDESVQTTQSGSYYTLPIAESTSGALFTDILLCDTLLSINTDGKIFPAYYIDFGAKSSPKKIGDSYDLYTISERIDKSDPSKYAILLQGSQENERYLIFTYGYNNRVHLARYDKKSMELNSFVIKDFETNNYKDFTLPKLKGNILYFVLAVSETADVLNPVVLKYNINNLK